MKPGATMWIEDSDLDFSKKDPRDVKANRKWPDEDVRFYTNLEWAKKFHERVKAQKEVATTA